MNEYLNQTPEQIEDFIVNGIEKYHLSDEHLIGNLSDFGLNRQEAKKIIVETRKKHNLFAKKHILDEEANIFTDLIILIYALLIVVSTWSFIQILNDKEAISYGGNLSFAHADAVLGGLLVGLSVFTAIRVFFCKSDGAVLSYIYLAFSFVSNTVCLLLSMGDVHRILFVLVWCVFFGLYVWASPTFNKNFPKAHIYWFDIVIIVGIILAVAHSFFHTRDNNKEKPNYPYVLTQDDYQIDLANYVDRINEQIPFFDYGWGQIDDLEYSTKENVVQLSVSDTLTDPQAIAVLDKMNEYYSEESILILIKNRLPDSMLYYMYGTDASLSYILKHKNGDVYLSKKVSYETIMATPTDEEYMQFWRENVRMGILNMQCPQIIDEYTTLKACSYEMDKSRVVLEYIFNMDKASITKDIIEAYFQNLKLGLHLTKNSLYSYIAGKISVRYDIYDRNGIYITSLDLTPEELKNL